MPSRYGAGVLLAGVLLCANPGRASALEGLDAAGPYPQHTQAMMTFGRLVGSWDLVVEILQEDGTWVELAGAWHFGWVLQGRAVQDVWSAWPPDRGPDAPLGYGTTVRVYDPAQGVWHVNWIGPLNQSYTSFVARELGSEIVMDATDDDSNPMQWIFSDITQTSFRWRAQDSQDGGRTWNVVQRMTAKRR